MGQGNENQKPVTDQYRTAWDAIFGKKKQTEQNSSSSDSDLNSNQKNQDHAK